MSKEYYKKKIIELRAKNAKEKEAKKRDNTYYADKVKGASGHQIRHTIASVRLTTLLLTTAISSSGSEK